MQQGARGLAVAAALLFLAPAVSAVTPSTIPALREWTPAAGEFQLSATSQIVVQTPDLLPDAEVFAEDLAELLGHAVPVVSAPRRRRRGRSLARPRRGRRPARPRGLSPEHREHGRDHRDRGCRRLLRHAYGAAAAAPGEHDSRRRGARLAALSRARPDDRRRARLLHAGMDRAAHQGARLSEDELLPSAFQRRRGFRIESETHPGDRFRPAPDQAEVREIIALAARYHIEVVPSSTCPATWARALARIRSCSSRTRPGQEGEPARHHQPGSRCNSCAS